MNELVAQRVTGDTVWARPALHHRKGRSTAEASACLVAGDEQLRGRSWPQLTLHQLPVAAVDAVNQADKALPFDNLRPCTRERRPPASRCCHACPMAPWPWWEVPVYVSGHRPLRHSTTPPCTCPRRLAPAGRKTPDWILAASSSTMPRGASTSWRGTTAPTLGGASPRIRR